MKRLLCVTALFAVVLIPDWASACWPWGERPMSTQARSAPLCRGIVYYSVQPVYCQPVYGQPVYVVPGAVPAPMNPPSIVPGRGGSDASRTDPPRHITQPDVTPAQPIAAPPEREPVRPTAAVEVPKPKPEPAPAPAPAPVEPKRGSAADNSTDNLPPLVLPRRDEDPKLPPLVLPKRDENSKNSPPNVPKSPQTNLLPPGGNPTIPSLDPPKNGPDPKLPPLELPGGSSAVPAPAPAPDALIPAPGVPSAKNPDALPPLTLPPDSPIGPSKPVEVKSSPLSVGGRDLSVRVFPATGPTVTTGLRKIGFYNHTKRDLALTIEGKTVTLPAMSYLHAHVPATFTWQCADRPATKETVPASAEGLDVLIRE
jgi:hypothetical protein